MKTKKLQKYQLTKEDVKAMNKAATKAKELAKALRACLNKKVN